jgi:hypothetical protein
MFFSIDGTCSERLAKFINDSPKPWMNCRTKCVLIDSLPHILIFAVKDIPAGTELRYSYNDNGCFAWRKVPIMHLFYCKSSVVEKCMLIFEALVALELRKST